MVDFQARDTRRGPTDDGDDATDDTADGESEGESSAQPADEEPTPEANTDRAGPDDGTTDDSGADPLAEETGPAAERDDTEPTRAGTATDETGTTATRTASVDVAVVTVSGDRAALEDAVTAAFESAGHTVVRHERLRGGYDAIQQMVETLVAAEGVDAVVTVGGVGLGTDEMAIEAVHPLLEKALPGFGEVFRARLADHVGTGIVGVRSTAGVSEGTLVFCLPGDAEAAALAVSEILAVEVPELAAALD